MVYVTRKLHFNAAHRLHNPAKTEEWNQVTFGDCNHHNWHGHNYELYVTVAGMPNPETGYVIDLGKLKSLVEEKIIKKCDHRNLNIDVDFLSNVIPSTENLVIAFYNELEQEVNALCKPFARLYSVKLFETERNSAEYCPVK
ncbi:6-carboxytetrahydropterin synthase [bacterium]|nr:MAG: 6-carboxytetrahydropterin synthase [bacterium]